MRVAMIGLFGLRPKGTMSVRALPLAKALAAKGHKVDIIMPPWSYPQDSGREWEENGVGICNVVLPTHFPLIRHLIITWRLVRRALSLRPDVVHCFKPKGYAGLVAMTFWLLKRLGLTKARLVVDSDDWEGKGGWNEIEPYTGLQKRFFAWQERWGLTHCDALTVASRALETIAWSLGVEPGRVFYVPNGVVSSFNIQYSISNIQFTDHPTVLLYTRFFEFQVERVVDIFQRVLAEVPQAKLLVVGKGFFGEEERLRELMQEAGIADHLAYADWVEPDELPAYFAAADMAIYPYDDTLINRTKCSVKLIDLMAAGVPVVADDVGQNGEYVVHSISGLLVPAGETDTFADSVVELLRDQSLRAKLERGAQRRVFEEFNWGKLVERVEEAYGSSKFKVQSPNGRKGETMTMVTKLQAKRWLYYWLPALLWMGVIFVASSQPKLPFVVSKTVDFVTKKAGHVAEYGVLAFLLWRAISKSMSENWFDIFPVIASEAKQSPTCRLWGVLRCFAPRNDTDEEGWPALPSLGGAFVLSLLYAVSDEFHQTFVPGRTGRLTDVGFDALGAILALGLVWWFSGEWDEVFLRCRFACSRWIARSSGRGSDDPL